MNAVMTVGLKHLKDIWQDNHIGDNIMENSEEIISRLKFIGRIQKEEKIDVRHVNRQTNNLLTKVTRTLLYPDNRTNALRFVREVIARSFEIIELQHGSPIVCKGIVNDLVKARTGIMNLQYTYNDDTKFCCDMDVIIENIVTQLSNLRDKYPDLFEQTPGNSPKL